MGTPWYYDIIVIDGKTIVKRAYVAVGEPSGEVLDWNLHSIL